MWRCFAVKRPNLSVPGGGNDNVCFGWLTDIHFSLEVAFASLNGSRIKSSLNVCPAPRLKPARPPRGGPPLSLDLDCAIWKRLFDDLTPPVGPVIMLSETAAHSTREAKRSIL